MKIDPNYLGLLETKEKTLLLGIIAESGDVLLRVANSGGCPGHGEWVRLEPRIKPKLGFSLIACEGRAQVIMKVSRLNPAENDFVLGQEAADELKRILPLDHDFREYGH